MKSYYPLLVLSALSTHIDRTSAFWRLACSTVQTARIDPVLDPGLTSGHVHKIAGGNNINQNSTYDTLQSSTCSSCEVQEDKSAYWSPQLYYSHSNSTVQEVRNEGMTVYYVGRGGNSSNTVPFPPGFRMLSGNSTVRSYDNSTLTYLDTRPVSDRVSFRCIDENNDIPEQHYMFDTNCVSGMRAQINFQSCWDGVNLYLPDQSHVAYLSGIDYGVCPPTHPVPIPGLFFEVLYFTNEIDQSAGGTFTFAQGDTTGYGFHGDFLNGWNMDVQTTAVQNCLYDTADEGVVSACSALAPSDDVNVPRDCLPAPPLNDEPVLGFLTQLPGCNQLSYGPASVPQVLCPLDSNQPISTQTLTSATTAYIGETSTVTDSLSYTTLTATAASETFVITVATDTAAATAATTFIATSFTLSSSNVSSLTSETTDSFSESVSASSYTITTSETTNTVFENMTIVTTTPSTFSFGSSSSSFIPTNTAAVTQTTISTTDTNNMSSIVTTDTAAGSFDTTFVTVTIPITQNITLTSDTTMVVSTGASTGTSTTSTLFAIRGRAIARATIY